jgi:hypothetical protein
MVGSEEILHFVQNDKLAGERQAGERTSDERTKRRAEGELTSGQADKTTDRRVGSYAILYSRWRNI